MQPSQATSDAQPGRDGRLVLRNTMYLGIAEVLSLPISVLLNAMMGRYLGAADLGNIYLATTIAAMASLVVGWGHQGSLPAAVAVDRESAGKLLGSSIAWRLVASVLVYGIVAGGCRALGFTDQQQWAFGLVFLGSTVGTIVAACQSLVRGFERTDVDAYTRVASQLAAVFLVIPVLVAGGRLRLVLLVQALAGLVVLVIVVRAVSSIGIGRLGWDRAQFKKLMVGGTPFVFFQLVLVLQPNIDAFYLAKLTSAEVVGWYAVAQRLAGCVLLPATALIGALYPTLCRLHATDRAGFGQTTRESIATVCLIVVPAALGCALYPDIGVAIFGRAAFRPAEETVRLFGLNLVFVYFSMPIGIALLAAGRQRAWTVVQLLCLVNSALLDPFLIRYFQASTGNGGNALPVVATISEMLMVSAGIWLMPKGVFDLKLAKTLGLAMLSGCGMAGAAFALRGLPSLLAAPIALLSYGIALFATGGVTRDQVASLQAFVQRKVLRRRSASG
jgi:O-antigen/teichoic acid export membrane protein